MQDKESLEKVLSTKIKPIIDNAMKDLIGINMDNVSMDITDKIKKFQNFDFPIDILIPYKLFKKNLKKAFLIRLLKVNNGNISNTANMAKVDRRTVHRFIIDEMIHIKHFRENQSNVDYYKQATIKDLIDDAVFAYKDTIKAKKLNKLYINSSDISAEILKEVPFEYPSMAEIEIDFESRYIKKVLLECNFSVSKTAKRIGLRYETLHRKIKELNIKCTGY